MSIWTTYIAESVRDPRTPDERHYILVGSEAEAEQTKQVLIAKGVGCVATGRLSPSDMDIIMDAFGSSPFLGQYDFYDPLAQSVMFNAYNDEQGHRMLKANTLAQATTGAISPEEYGTRRERLDFLFGAERVKFLTAAGLVAAPVENTYAVAANAYEVEDQDLGDLAAAQLITYQKLNPKPTHEAFQMQLVTQEDGFLDLTSHAQHRQVGTLDEAGAFVPVLTFLDPEHPAMPPLPEE